ncbi:hypothetical protein Pan44_23710 [Caulifigura coniformis]|uniref:Thioredoxin-like fold domain-containing protein n=1 Tax=Caulifigura coniformis TaxID=2527983 RepID=A0A517SDZ9_9PLAN|nr:TlpA disulfide reductase family protein [Caulifigura coniformis]QDT54338.1 hypothetical protein Pan44_23710 [Caulifigura coniformis]
MAMLPQEKQLVDDLQGKPFQMLSVCNDPTLESARATAAEKGMTWPNWFDGEAWTTEAAGLSRDETGIRPAGAIARQWNVRGWPTIYVLDEKGMIRARHLRGEGLNAMVHQLVAALENR